MTRHLNCNCDHLSEAKLAVKEQVSHVPDKELDTAVKRITYRQRSVF